MELHEKNPFFVNRHHSYWFSIRSFCAAHTGESASARRLPERSDSRHIPPLPKPDPAGRMTLERLKHMDVSGVVYAALLQEAERNAAIASTEVTSVFAGDSSVRQGTLKMPGFHVVPDAFVGSTVNASNDTAQDVEPTAAAVNIGGTMHTATVAIKFARATPN